MKTSARSLPAFRRTAISLALASAMAPLPSLALPAGVPAGSVFQVNTQIFFQQTDAAIAMDDDGDFVVVWQSYDNTGITFHINGIYAQRYNAAGAPQGAEFQVSANAQLGQGSVKPVVAMDADGDFVVAWVGSDGDSYGVYAQRYNAAGLAQAGQFRVNTTTTSAQQSPAVAMDADGDFVVAWESYNGGYYDVLAQRYSAAGTALGGEIVVSTPTVSNTLRNHSVAMDADGDFVVAWNDDRVRARLYSAGGVAQGGEILVNTTDNGIAGAVAMDAGGGFVVVWEAHDFVGSSQRDVFARRYDAAGTAQGAEFQVNTTTTDEQFEPAIAMDDDGDFLISWSSASGVSYISEVYARRYDAAGAAQSPEFLVGGDTPIRRQYASAVAMDGDGDLVIGWTDLNREENVVGIDEAGGIFAQRYAHPADLGLSGAADPATITSDGGDVDYNLTVSHVSGLDTDGVTLDLGLPMGFVYTGASGADWSCDESSPGVLRCEYGPTLGVGASTMLTISAEAGGAPGSRELAALVSATRPDVETANSEALVPVTLSVDTAPAAFVFPNKPGVPTSTQIESKPVTLSSFNTAAPVTMLGAGEYSLDGAAYTSSPGMANPGQVLRLRQLSSAFADREGQVRVSVGSTVGSFRIKTRSYVGDIDPNPFNFNNSSNLPLNTLVQSKPYMPVGYDSPAPISVSGGDYSIDGAAFTAAAGTISPGSTLRVRTTSPATNDTRFELQLQIGGTRAKWLGKTLP